MPNETGKLSAMVGLSFSIVNIKITVRLDFNALSLETGHAIDWLAKRIYLV